MDALRMNTAMDARELIATKTEVDRFNKEIGMPRGFKESLDKDDFLKLLVTQLQHQDPTAPMEDREFIAQMAQFSSLEQMNNVSQGLQKLSGLLNSGEAQSLLGRAVEIVDGEAVVTGTVSQIVRGEYPLVMVEGKYYDLDQVSKVGQ